MSKDIYSLDMLEELEIPESGLTVRRVPGGWIFTNYRLDYSAMQSTFVPYTEKDPNISKTEKSKIAVFTAESFRVDLYHPLIFTHILSVEDLWDTKFSAVLVVGNIKLGDSKMRYAFNTLKSRQPELFTKF